MGGNHEGAGNVQHHGEQILHVEAEYGPAVGFQVAYGFQLFAEPVGGLEIGHIHKAVYLADRAVFLVNGTDFRLKHELRLMGGKACEVGNLPSHVVAREGALQAEKPAFLVHFQVVAQFLPPYGVGEVARGEYVDTLDAGPCGKMRQSEAGAGGAGKTGMDVQIGSEHG